MDLLVGAIGLLLILEVVELALAWRHIPRELKFLVLLIVRLHGFLVSS